MKAYGEFMDRQRMSEAGHQKLLNLQETRQKCQPIYWKRWVIPAACCALAVGVGAYALHAFAPAGAPTLEGPTAATGAPAVTSPVTAHPTTQPILSGDETPDAPAGFTAQGPGEDAKLMFPNIHGVDYADVTDGPLVAADIALPEGAFSVNLTKEDVQKLFWGPEGKPAVENPKTDPGDFPIMLMNWAGYEITGQATYDGNGDLWELSVQGTKDDDSFTLRAAPGYIPPTCVVERGAAVTDVLGVEVKGWYRSYDRDGDDETEHICTSEFLSGGVGFRFENVGSGGMKAGTDEATDLGGAMLLNQMAVTQLCHTDGFYLDQFAHTDDIPSWTEESYDALDAALAGAENFAFSHPEADFLPYLPAQGPQGYGEFHARLSYQEGTRKELFFRWTKGYDDVEVDVHLPEGSSNERFGEDLVDVSVPASYDWRLYDGSISDSVPQEYQQSFFMPAFRAQDMSLEVVKARMRDKDTGGRSCRFWVLHENGAAVGYDCSGVSAQYVWSLVEATL